MIEEEVTELSGEWLDEPRSTRWHPKNRSSAPTKECPEINLIYPPVSVLCDSITASKSKCGFQQFTSSATPHYYFKKQVDVTATGDCTIHSFMCDLHVVLNGTSTIKYAFDETTCAYLGEQSCTGSESDTRMYTPLGCDGGVDCSGSVDMCAATRIMLTTSGTRAAHGILGHCYGISIHGDGSDWSVISTQTTRTTDTPGTTGACENIKTVETLSDEYTTALLKSNTESILPAYSTQYAGAIFPPNTCCCSPSPSYTTGQFCHCSAFRNLPTSEFSYTIRRFKYEFDMSETGLAIYWDEINTPTGGSPSVTASDSGTIGTPYEIMEPSSNGTTTIGHINRQYRFEFVDPGFDFDLSWVEHIVPGTGSPHNVTRTAHYTTGDDPVLGPYTPTVIGDNTTTITAVVCGVTMPAIFPPV